MVQILPPKTNIGVDIGKSLGAGIGNYLGDYYANKSLDKILNDPALKDAPLSERWSAIERTLAQHGERGQKLLKNRLAIEQQGEQEKEKKKQENKAKKAQGVLGKILNGEKVSDEEMQVLPLEIQIKAKKAMQQRPPAGGISGQPVPPEVAQAIPNILNANKNASADELAVAFDSKNIPRAYSNSYIENRRRQDESLAKTKIEKEKLLREESLPIRQEISEKADVARKGIENKEHLIDLIKTNKINDPTYAIFAEALPFNLGKRLLSNETVEYKAGLIDEFGDLRKIFQGQTRIKEIELLEQKIADIYLTDEQKETILKSRINALKADIIREETAAELEAEGKFTGVLQFRKAVEDRAKPKLDALFNKVLDEQNAVIRDAENRKKIPLDINDPEDVQIIDQILNEAKGDHLKAAKLAKEKGYSF